MKHPGLSRIYRLLFGCLLIILPLLALQPGRLLGAPGVVINNNRAPGVEVGPDNMRSATPGSTVIYQHTLTNSGTTTDQFGLILDSSQGWQVSTSYITQTLAPGQSSSFSVQVIVPAAAPLGAVDITQLTAYPISFPLTTDSATDTTTVTAATNTPTPTASPTTSPTSQFTSTPTQTPTATSTATRTPTPTASPTRDTTIYADQYEPNNAFQAATDITPNGDDKCNNTLWPVGDIDYYRFYGKAGSTYTILTKNLIAGVDTYMQAYDTVGNVIASNDDYTATARDSKVTIFTGVSGYYYASIVNLDPSDPADKTFCVEVNVVESTATPTQQVLATDTCEPNGSFDTACLLEVGRTYNFDFVPPVAPGPDNDFFRIWIKPGILYTCETSNLSGVNDTNMILYDQNRVGLGGNDDKAVDDFGSAVSYFSTYTGWLYILIGPYATPAYDQSDLYTYDLACTSVAATPTVPATPTRTPAPGGGFFPTPVPLPTSTPTPAPTSDTGELPPMITSPTPRPVVVIRPLPTSTPASAPAPTLDLTVTLYYDVNGNFAAELNEGIMDVSVALYASVSGELLAFGYTNDAGMVRFGPLAVSGPVRVSVPFLNFSQTVAADVTAMQIRVAPQQLPGFIP